MLKSLLLQYALRAIGSGAAIIAGSLTAKYGVDGDTAAAIQSGIVASLGLALEKGVSWWQTRTDKARVDNQAAKIAIVAKETEVALPPAKVEAAQVAYDQKKERVQDK